MAKFTVHGANDDVPLLDKKQQVPSSDNKNTSPLDLAILIKCINRPYLSYYGIPGKFISLEEQKTFKE